MVFFSGCPGKHVLAVDRGHSREALGSFLRVSSGEKPACLIPGPGTMPEREVIDKPLLMRWRD